MSTREELVQAVEDAEVAFQDAKSELNRGCSVTWRAAKAALEALNAYDKENSNSP